MLRWGALCAAVVLVIAVFRGTPGTPDVEIWRDWFQRVTTSGPVSGYAAIAADYPPGASTMLWTAGHLAPATAFPQLLKILLSVWLVATTALIGVASRRPGLAAFTLASLALSAMGLMYLDILFAPLLVAGVWAFRARRIPLGVGCLLLASLMKWQPLLILPMALIHGLKQRGLMAPAPWRATIRWTVAVLIAIVAGVLAIYGGETLQSLYRASRHTTLGSFGANVPWLMTWSMGLDDPGRAASGGIVEIIYASRFMLRVLSVVTLVAYGAILRAYWRSPEKTVDAWLLYALAGYLSYFLFSAGVHENHLFAANVLGLGLVWCGRRYWPIAIGVALAANLNLLAFYGWDGYVTRRALIGVDLTVWLAAANCIAASFFFRYVWRRTRVGHDPELSTRAPSPTPTTAPR